jgi:hypothetical protein
MGKREQLSESQPGKKAPIYCAEDRPAEKYDLVAWRLPGRVPGLKPTITYLDTIDNCFGSAALCLRALPNGCWSFLILAPCRTSKAGAAFWFLPVTFCLSGLPSALEKTSTDNLLTFLSTHAPQLSVGLLRLRFWPFE